MRVCELHRERVVDTLVSRLDGTEYDLCPLCQELFGDILSGKPRVFVADPKKINIEAWERGEVEPIKRKRVGRPPKATPK